MSKESMKKLRDISGRYLIELRARDTLPHMNLAPVFQGSFSDYAEVIEEWMRCYDGALEGLREAERRLRELGGTTLDGVRHRSKDDDR